MGNTFNDKLGMIGAKTNIAIKDIRTLYTIMQSCTVVIDQLRNQQVRIIAHEALIDEKLGIKEDEVNDYLQKFLRIAQQEADKTRDAADNANGPAEGLAGEDKGGGPEPRVLSLSSTETSDGDEVHPDGPAGAPEQSDFGDQEPRLPCRDV